MINKEGNILFLYGFLDTELLYIIKKLIRYCVCSKITACNIRMNLGNEFIVDTDIFEE